MIRALYTIFREAVSAFLRREGDLHAGYIAYALLLAIFPFLIFAVSLTGLIIGESRSSEAVGVLFDFAPQYLAEVLEPVLVQVLSQSHSLFTLFIVLAIWAAMRAVEAINMAFERTYSERGGAVWAIRKAKAVVVVIVAAVVTVVLGLSILLAPVLINLVEGYTTVDLPQNLLLTRYAVGTMVFYLFLWSLHWFLPNHHARGYAIWPGALTSTVLWVAMATGMSIYLAYAGSYTVAYGALSGIVVTMLFLYFSGAIIIFGAEMNGAVRRYKEGRV
ncbi:MAG: YihY/virulence factor BrkB family protein [Rhodobacteraceae bacterium]|nr:YihY/virulence factor BrkB family protein [Paracoccaceae bacterium]